MNRKELIDFYTMFRSILQAPGKKFVQLDPKSGRHTAMVPLVDITEIFRDFQYKHDPLFKARMRMRHDKKVKQPKGRRAKQKPQRKKLQSRVSKSNK